MDPESIAKTHFPTKYGHYQYTLMPFGLKNDPITSQRCMNILLEELFYKGSLVYLDDIIIFFLFIGGTHFIIKKGIRKDKRCQFKTTTRQMRIYEKRNRISRSCSHHNPQTK